jgi:hypothetical protein
MHSYADINHGELELRGRRKVEMTRHTNNRTYKSQALQYEKLKRNGEVFLTKLSQDQQRLFCQCEA